MNPFRRAAVSLGLVLCLGAAPVVSACTIQEGKDYNVDIVFNGLYTHLHANASKLIVTTLLINICKWSTPCVQVVLRDSVGPQGGSISADVWDRAVYYWVSVSDISDALAKALINHDCLRFWYGITGNIDWIHEPCVPSSSGSGGGGGGSW
jgi:hypothetical protein